MPLRRAERESLVWLMAPDWLDPAATGLPDQPQSRSNEVLSSWTSNKELDQFITVCPEKCRVTTSWTDDKMVQEYLDRQYKTFFCSVPSTNVYFRSFVHVQLEGQGFLHGIVRYPTERSIY